MPPPEDDPLDLERIDREIRINQMEEELKALSGGNVFSDNPNNACPPEVREKFLQHVLKFERGEWTTHIELLQRAGIAMPPPDELDDATLSTRLWEVIHGLERLHTYLYCTNHLNDRELYEHLWKDALREHTVDMSDDPDGACHLDLLGSGSDEDTRLYLKYYADENWRRDWLGSFPDYELPPHEDPPHDRDRRLPKR